MIGTDLNPNSPLPLYHQLKEILRHRIVHEWPVGSLIPTEQELIKEFKVSRTTVREAIMALVNEDLLEKKQGKGTIVTATKVEEKLGKLTGFAEEIAGRGLKHSARLLSCEFKTDLYYEISKLKLPIDASVFVIDRIQLADQEPFAYERSCWPEDLGQLLMVEDLNAVAFYQVLEKHGIALNEAIETIHAVNATKYEAEMLGINFGDALLERRRVSFDHGGRPIEYTKTKYRSDKYSYQAHLKR
ncbi:GntR family transcriptional regulator [Ammoniphilus sp. CFH 90114]|uniref:GntR family transcriptional regulator n=1 Tax=Ammoniphilus sp. CFH 90114 TaxID=2493665 RepID=UPI00100F0957|nr:GntR family transcriptional regulator [Ammoniphilus sp. CFH 90114]RXT03748.1 GntR family transcriptional regulator [Ammoniphilus sp. CFH 90114]